MAIGEQHSVKIPAEVYRILVEKARAEDRSLASILRRSINGACNPGSPQYEATVDHYLNSVSLARVQDRWRKAAKR